MYDIRFRMYVSFQTVDKKLFFWCFGKEFPETKSRVQYFVALGLVPNKRRIDLGRYWGWETFVGGKQKLDNNLK